MISISGVTDDVLLWCLSTDTLPTQSAAEAEGKVLKLNNGAMAYQMDTQTMFVYDKENDTWIEV